MANEFLTKLFKRSYYDSVKQFSLEVNSGFLKRALDEFLKGKTPPLMTTFEYEEFFYSNKQEIESLAKIFQEGERIKQQYITACVHFLQIGVPLTLAKSKYLIENEEAIRITAEFLEKQKIDIGDFWNTAKKGLRLTPYENLGEPFISDRKELMRRIDFITSHAKSLGSYKHLRLYFGQNKIAFDSLVDLIEDDTISDDYSQYLSLFRTAFEQYPATMRNIYEAKSFNALRQEFSLGALIDAVKINESYLSQGRNKTLVKILCDGVVPSDFDLSPENFQLKRRVVNYMENARFGDNNDPDDYNVTITYIDRNSYLTELFGTSNYGKIKESVPLSQCYQLAQVLSQNNTTIESVHTTALQNKEAIKEYNRLKTGKRQLLIKNLEQIAYHSPALFGFIEKWNLVQDIWALKGKYPYGFSCIVGDPDQDELLALSMTDLKQKLQLERQMEEQELQQREFDDCLEQCKAIREQFPGGFVAFLSNNGISSLESATLDQLQLIESNRDRIQLIEVKRRALSILSKYPEAAREKYGVGLATFRAVSTLEKANAVIESESALKERQKQLVRNRDIKARLQRAVSDWEEVKGIPYYHFFWYYPKSKFNEDEITDVSITVRRLVYSFKDGVHNDTVRSIVVQKLQMTFDSEDLRRLTFVCIPASTISVNRERYEYFSYRVCHELGMTDAFDHITITKEKTASHLGGEDSAEFTFDIDFFRGRMIVLFDDIVTRGGSMQRFKSIMEGLGATVICALSIGRTYSNFYGENRQPHPWNGKM